MGRSRRSGPKRPAGQPPQAPLQDRLNDGTDPGGLHAAALVGLAALDTSPLAAAGLRDLGVDLSAVHVISAEMTRLSKVTLDAVDALPSLRWVPCDAMPADAYATALSLLAEGDPDAPEQVLVDAWNNKSRLRRPVNAVAALGLSGTPLRTLQHRRAVLLHKAVQHHLAGAFEAFIPIVFAQIEDLVADVSGGHLFLTSVESRQADIAWAQPRALQADEARCSAGQASTSASGRGGPSRSVGSPMWRTSVTEGDGRSVGRSA